MDIVFKQYKKLQYRIYKSESLGQAQGIETNQFARILSELRKPGIATQIIETSSSLTF